MWQRRGEERGNALCLAVEAATAVGILSVFHQNGERWAEKDQNPIWTLICSIHPNLRYQLSTF